MACSKKYNLDGKKGIALIVSNDYVGTEYELQGTHEDSKRMEEVFSQFQYYVIKIQNVNKNVLERHFTALSECIYPPTCRRIVVTFSGHGGDGVLLSQDLQKIKVEDIINQLKPDGKNPTLGNTVRICFFDACRGDHDDEGYIAKGQSDKKGDTEEDDTSEDVAKVLKCIRIPKEGNMFVGYSSTRFRPSYLYPDGSLFTRILADELLCDAPLNTNFINANAKMRKVKVNGKYFQTAQCTHDLAEVVNFIKECQGNVMYSCSSFNSIKTEATYN